MRSSIIAILLLTLGYTNGYGTPVSSVGSKPCVQFSILTQDVLKNVKQGLSPQDVKWYQDKIEKKYPAACYVAPSPIVSLVFVVIVTPDTYHGTRIVTTTQSNPVNGTVTDEDGDTATISGTQETTSSTAVPYSFEYGIFTLSVEQKEKNGSYFVLHRFQQKGIYRTMYGIPLGGKGHHPFHAVIEEAAEWINKGGLAEAEKLYAEPSETPDGQTDRKGPETVESPQTKPVSDAVLDISSMPAGAEIDVDGAYVGNTPATLQVAHGEHVIAIKKAGYVPWERKITAMPGHASVSLELQTNTNPEAK